MTEVSRPLSIPEATLLWFHLGAPIHFSVIADVVPTAGSALTEARLRAALAAVQARHPLLRVRIVGGLRAPRYEPSDGPIPLSVEEVPQAAWGERLNAEMALPTPEAPGPLCRVALLRDPTASDGPQRLLITLHHCISDGRSGVYLARDLMRALGGETLAALAPAPTTWDARPRSVRGLNAFLQGATLVLRDLWRILRVGRPRQVRVEKRVPLRERRPHIIARTFDAEFTAALTERARAERTTVHGVLSAVMCQNLAAEHGGRAPVSCGSPVELRADLEPPIGEDVGYFIGLSQTLMDVDASGDVFELARTIRRGLLEDKAKSRHIGFHALGALMFKLFTLTRPSPQALCQRVYDLPIRGSTGITNLGRLDVATQFGDLELQALFFAVSTSALADAVSSATCFNGRLHWTFTTMTPAVSVERAERDAAEAEARLRRAVADAKRPLIAPSPVAVGSAEA